VSAETERLALLEATLVGAAAVQARRRQRRRRRALVLAVVIAPLALAAAGSVARTGVLKGVDHNLSTLRDDRFAAPAGAAAKLAGALGARSRDRQSERRWRVGSQRVVGYTTPSGRFCYSFVALTGGCLAGETLTNAHPLNPTIEHPGGLVRIYGLAADEVIGVTVRAGAVRRRAALGRNAFYFQMNSPGGRQGFTLTLVAQLRDGAFRQMRIPVGEMDTRPSKMLPRLPGVLTPVEDTAA
jgi:hypothetical protein